MNGRSLPFCRWDETTAAQASSKKVTIQAAIFEFGDDMNDLNMLEMLMSYEEIELRVRFANA